MFTQTFDDVAWPAVEPFDAGMLPVSDGHAIYYEQSGNPDGVPLVFLHGGPGNGVRPFNRRYYDPSFWRIVMLDQRGCGRSTPHGEMRANSTRHLIQDLERLRHHLGIGRWLVAGGSWGSFLALAYGQAHPDSCLGFLIRGVFLGRRHEVDWWWHTGIRRLYADRWAGLNAFIPESERGDLLAAYHRRLMDPDPAVHEPAVRALGTFSAWTGSFAPTQDAVAERLADLRAGLALGRSFTHYCTNRFFVEEGQLLHDLPRITHLPCAIVQGRNDAVTPMENAWEVHSAWPGSTLDIVDMASHNIQEPPMARALVRAAEDMKARVAPQAATA